MTEIDSPDGLPIVQPTRSRVDQFLETVNRDPDEKVGEIPPAYRSATVEKVATNAVMAGCEPEYFPVVLTALEATLEPKFNLYGALATTHPCWPSVIVNGPVIEELGINGGANAYGQGTKPNVTIGRSLTFVFLNAGGAVPGQGDKATHGGPHKIGLCVAENESESPWEPLHVERGYERDESAVTVTAAESPTNINDHVSDTAAGILTTATQSMANVGTNLAYLNKHGEPHLVLSPEHAQTIARDDWSKMDVKRFVYDQARIPFDHLREYGMDMEDGGGWPPYFRNLRGDQTVGLAAKPENVLVTVTGGVGRHSLFHPSFGDTESVTKPIPEY